MSRIQNFKNSSSHFPFHTSRIPIWYYFFMNYLGVDYGKKKVGLAMSEGQVASPLKVLEVTSLKDAVNKVSQVIKKEEINRVVVGVPEGGEAKSITRKFLNELKNSYKKEVVEIIEYEETLTSADAKRLMIDLNLSRKRRKNEDAYSASIILQNFLNSLN